MTYDDMRYLITGVEDGWIKVDSETLEAYEKAKKEIMINDS